MDRCDNCNVDHESSVQRINQNNIQEEHFCFSCETLISKHQGIESVHYESEYPDIFLNYLGA